MEMSMQIVQKCVMKEVKFQMHFLLPFFFRPLGALMFDSLKEKKQDQSKVSFYQFLDFKASSQHVWKEHYFLKSYAWHAFSDFSMKTTSFSDVLKRVSGALC